MTFKEKINVIKRSAKLLEKANKGIFRRGTINHLPEVIGTFSGIYLASLVIDGVMGGKSVSYLLTAALIVCGIDLISYFIRHINNRHYAVNDTVYFKNVERFLCEKVMNMDYARVEDIDTRNKLDNAKIYVYNYNFGLPSLLNLSSRAFRNLFELILAFVLAAPVLFASSGEITDFKSFLLSGWGAAAVLIICGISAFVQSAFLIPKSEKYMNDVRTDKAIHQAERIRGFYQNHTIYNYRNGKNIRIYAEQELIEESYKKAQNTITSKWKKSFVKVMLVTRSFDLIELFITIMLYSFAIFRAVSGAMTAGEVVAFVMYFSRIQYAVLGISDIIASLLSRAPMWQQLFDFLDIPDEKYKGTIPTEKRDDNEYEFEFKHVYFKYPDSEDYVLKDVNLKWRIGEKMALVGKNGCGKSTLVKLLTRLYDPTEGEITLNGIDIRKYKYEEYMALFSVVFQDSKLFSFSLAENVAADTEYDAELVESCVRRAGLSERLDTMENGIETCLYKDFDDKGVEISGGEMQKLCLARAIYKGSPFIVLDEPTAALDPISEHDIYTKFNGIVGTRTAIYISHRLSSCRFCDEITVMDNGRIAERGSHDELIGKGGVYKELWTAQAEYYKDTAGELYA
ncbi:MAG: ABC transporter ATP-binding protein [Ruminiclostridium sp.]|nr:ABC transporter ATP-binding protein [Ruminiclostridium sp.]